MAGEQEIIDSYLDIVALTGQTDVFLAQLKRLDDAYNSLSSKSINLGGLGSTKEISAQIKQLQEELARLQKQKEEILTTDIKAAKVAQANANAEIASIKLLREQEQQLADQKKKSAIEQNALDKKNAEDARENARQKIIAINETAKAQAEADAEAAAAKGKNFTRNGNGTLVEQPIENAGQVVIPSKVSGAAPVAQLTEIEATAAALNEEKAALAGLQAEQKQLTIDFEAGAITAAQYQKELARLTVAQVEAKQTIASFNVELNNLVKSSGAAVGSLEEQRAELILLNQQYALLSTTEKEAASGIALQKQITANTEALKLEEAALGQAQRNVGNYGSGFDKVGKQLDKFTSLSTIAATTLSRLFRTFVGFFIISTIIDLVKKLGDILSEPTAAEKKLQDQTNALTNQVKALDSAFKDLALSSSEAVAGQAGNVAIVRDLAEAVTNGNLPYAERQRALDKLKETNKAYFGDLTLETASYTALKAAVDQYVASIINQAVIKEFTEEIGKTSKAIIDSNDATEKSRNKLTQATNEQANAQKVLNAAQLKQGTDAGDAVATRALVARDAATRKVTEAQKALDEVLEKGDNLQFQRSDAERRLRDAEIESLKFKDPKPVGKTTNLKTELSKESDELIKFYIGIETDLSNAVEFGSAVRLAFRKREFQDELDLNIKDRDDKLAIERAKLKDVLNNPESNENAKINALNSYHARENTINDAFDQHRIVEEIKFQIDLSRIRGSAEQKRRDDLKRDQDLSEEILKKSEEARLKREEDNRKNRDSALSFSQDVDLIRLNRQYAQGLISTETYQRRKFEIEKEYSIKAQQNVIADAQKVIDDVKSQGVDIVAAQTKIEDAKRKISDETTQHLLDNQLKLREAEKATAAAAVSAIGELGGDVFDARKNAIQDEINQLDLQKQKQIEVVNASVASEQDKAAQIAIINSRADAQKQALEKRQKDQDVKKAEFDKIIAISQIAIQTAQSVQSLEVKVAQATAEAALLAGNPLTASYAGIASASAGAIASQIPLIIAQGVIAAGLIAARPIPRYKEGIYDKGRHPGGHAIVGDGGRPEYVLFPNGEGFTTPSHDTLMNLPKGAQVFPDANNLPGDVMRMAMRSIRPMPSTKDGSAALIGMMSKEIRQLRSAVIQKQENHFHWSNGELQKSIKNGESWTHYKNRLV